MVKIQRQLHEEDSIKVSHQAIAQFLDRHVVQCKVKNHQDSDILNRLAMGSVVPHFYRC